MNGRKTMASEVREAREMRARGCSVQHIAGMLDRSNEWVRLHAPAQPHAVARARMTAIIAARESGMGWEAIIERWGFPSRNAAESAVSKYRRKLRERRA